VCFGIIGGLAIALAVDAGGMATEPQGALNALARQGWAVRRLVPPEAAIDFNPSARVGIGGALSKLANASYGTWLLGRHRRRLDRLRRLRPLSSSVRPSLRPASFRSARVHAFLDGKSS
jgi:hypothetical protein